jgi:hypothetical protein
MLIIREAQMQVFSARAWKDFEDGRVPDIKSRFPNAFRRLEEPGVRRLVGLAVRRAIEFGIKAEADIEDLLDLMVLFGESFCDGPEFEFEAAPLRDETLPADARVALTMARFGVTSPLSEEQDPRRTVESS